MSTKALSAGSPSAGGPQLVIGLTAPRSEDSETGTRIAETRASQPSSEASGEAGGVVARADRPIPLTTQIGVPQLLSGSALLALAEAPLPDAEAERLEALREKSLEIVRDSFAIVRESLAIEEEAKASVEEAASLPPVEQTAAPLVAAAESGPFPYGDEPSSNDDEDSSATPVDSVSAAAASPAAADQTDEASVALATDKIGAGSGSLDAQVTALPTPDEISIPPVVPGDVVEPVAEKFFSQGELVAASAEEDEWEEAQNKAARKSLPHVVERRARLAKYVRWAVGGAAVLCIAAVGMSVVPRRAGAPARAAVAALEAPVVKAADVTAAPEAKPTLAAPAGQAPQAAPEAPANAVDAPAKAVEPAAVKAEEPAKTAEPAKAEEPAKAPASDKTALEEKNDARRALERGKSADAIAAGERSVALDPTDGEAWLLLGAAYQEKGKMADARRAYTACLNEGKRGPLRECRSMLR